MTRVAHPSALEVAPRIDDVIDLGALPLPANGPLSLEERDGRFTPGEWAVLAGPGLARADARVQIGGNQVPVAGYTDTGLIVRVPRGLVPHMPQRVRVETARGSADADLPYASHVVVSDVSGNRLRFLRMSRRAERLFEEPFDLELTRVRKHVFSADGGLVYAIQAHADEDDGRYKLVTVHAGAGEHPKQLGTSPLRLAGVPLDLVPAPERNQLWLLTQRELVVLELDATSVRESRRLVLPHGTPWSLVALDGSKRAVVLERESNVLWLVDMTAPELRIVQTLALPPEGTPRASLALLRDRSNPALLWVLQGRSLARLSKRTDRLLDRARSAIGLGGSEPEPVAPSEAPQARAGPPARVLGLKWTGSLALDRELPLPEAFVPLMLRASVDGRLLVSGVTSDAARLADFGETREDLRRVTAWLSGSVQFGRVIALDPTGARGHETLVQGMAMFFDVDQLPNGQLVYSVMRLGVHMIPPGLGVDWKIESPHVDSVHIRTLGWTFILPPYVSPPVSIQ